MENIKLNVKGMVCDGCEKRVENVLKDIDGIEEVKASHEAGIVEIKTSKEVDLSEVKEKIEDLDFEVVE